MSLLDNDNFAVLAAPWGNDPRPSLFYIKKRNTGTGRTEVHILSAASGHRSYSLHVGTGLHETHKHFVFKLADWDGDGIPDLWAIKKWATGTGRTEVHIFSGASNFATPIFHGATALHETGESFSFDILPRGRTRPPDLVAISRSSTGTRSTELHILSGASNFQDFVQHTGTGLHETGSGDGWSFAMTDWNADGTPDLVIVSPANGGELHSLRGPDFQNFNLHASVPDGNAQGILGIPDDKWAIIQSCGAAAAGVVGFWVAGALSFGATAAIFLPTYLMALDCYRNVQKFNRPAAQPSGSGGNGSSNVDPHPRERPWPREPSNPPGQVPAPPEPPRTPQPPIEDPPANDPGDPGPPPGPPLVS